MIFGAVNLRSTVGILVSCSSHPSHTLGSVDRACVFFWGFFKGEKRKPLPVSSVPSQTLLAAAYGTEILNVLIMAYVLVSLPHVYPFGVTHGKLHMPLLSPSLYVPSIPQSDAESRVSDG